MAIVWHTEVALILLGLGLWVIPLPPMFYGAAKCWIERMTPTLYSRLGST